MWHYSPFFAEAHVNPLFLEHERFPVKAHELAHLGGITSEAEANLIAYLIATNSDESEIQFDGNMFILSYVIRNARNFLPEEEYKRFLGRIDSGVMSLFNNSRQYWSDLYSDKVGSVQDFFYDFYLKRNNIPSGQANYLEVISLIIALREKEK